VFVTYPSLGDEQISQSDDSIVAMFDKFPSFLGSRVAVALTALNAGMSIMDITFLSQLNALALPLQSQLYAITCGRRNNTREVFNEFNTTRSAAALALHLQWPELNGFLPRTFVDQVMNSPAASGRVPVSTAANASESLFFRHADLTSLVFLRNVPRSTGKLAVPSAASVASACSSSAATCRSLTDGLLFLSNASTQAGFVLSPAAFRCPMCAQDAALLQGDARDALFMGLHKYASGGPTVDASAELALTPSATGEMNILASLKPLFARAAAALPYVSAVSATGMSGVSFVANDAADVIFKSNVLFDYSKQDWFVDAALRPSVLHVSHDAASDRSDAQAFSLILSVGIVAQPQGIPWSSSNFQTKGLAAVAHVRLQSSWISSLLAAALLQRDARHICMSTVGLCAILNSRGYILASTSANRSSHKHIQTMYPLLAEALLDRRVFLQTWTRPFDFQVASDLSVKLNSDLSGAWLLNDAAPSKFRIFLEDALYSVSIATLPATSCILLIVVPHHSLTAKVFELQLPPLVVAKVPHPLVRPALSPRAKGNSTAMRLHSVELSKVTQQYYCEPGAPPWLVGVSIGVALAVAILTSITAVYRYKLLQRLGSYFLQQKSSVGHEAAAKPSSDYSRYEFKLCSPDDFLVQKSILRCVDIFQKAFASLEREIVNFNTFSLSKRIIADDIDGQRMKIQNYLEVLSKQRTLLHERIVSRMCPAPPHCATRSQAADARKLLQHIPAFTCPFHQPLCA